MKCPFNKIAVSLMFGVLLFLISSCKKETIYNEIDAFADIQNKVTLDKGQYILSFTLASYPYSKVEVYVHDDLAVMYKQTGGKIYNAVSQSNNKYSVFFSPLEKSKKYYYQLIVNDSNGNTARSTTFNFTTQP
ncbi:hypothetical protein [Sphingobacterium sp.]|uniref:hypothetical protein n=1 Tax=Sphingobacterium sp. TaxID=341027 RepID=UPI0028A0565C|nr:hypothetical protein [Sphingobacterium sp.]